MQSPSIPASPSARRNLTRTAFLALLLTTTALHREAEAQPMMSEEEAIGLGVAFSLVAGFVVLGPLIANVVEISDGNGSPPGWTVFGGIVGGILTLTGIALIGEASNDDEAGLIGLTLGLGVTNLALAVAGAVQYDHNPGAFRVDAFATPGLHGGLQAVFGLSGSF